MDAAENGLTYSQMKTYDTAHSKWLVPFKRDKGDWLRTVARGIMTIPANVIHFVAKPIAMIRNSKNDDEKMDNLQENVNNLPEDEFETLKHGLESYKGDQAKVPASLRRAVKVRAEKEVLQDKQIHEAQIIGMMEQIRDDRDRIEDLRDEMSDSSTTPERKNQIQQEINNLNKTDANLVRLIEKFRDTAVEQGGIGLHGLDEEERAAREGSNLEGRKSARRTANDVELEKREAAIVKAQRESRESGDYEGEVTAFLEHEELLDQNTTTKRNLLGIKVSNGQRHHVQGILHKEYMNDDLVRNLISITGMALAARGFVKTVRDQQTIHEFNQDQQAINSGNVQTINGHNAQIDSLQQQIPGARQAAQAAQTQTGRMKDASAFAIEHDASGADVNWGHNNSGVAWSQTQADQALHAAEASGQQIDIDTAMQHYSGVNFGTKFSRATSQGIAQNYLNAGGYATIQKGYSITEQFFQQAEQLGKIAINPAGTVQISPDLITPAALAFFAGRGAEAIMREQQQVKQKKQPKKEKTNQQPDQEK